MRQPVFAIVGRPNVGKSTLFNRIAGRHISIVEDMPGVTRDRIYARAELDFDGEDAVATLIDTGGFEPAPSSELFAAVRQQTQLAIDEADVIIHVVDARQGVSPDDVEVARLLRKSGRPLVVAANKLDSPKQAGLEGAFYELGVDEVLPIAAAHGIGVADLLEAAWKKLPEELREGARQAAREAAEQELADADYDKALDEAELEAAANADEGAPHEKGETVVALPDVLRIAVVGRPNAGKSSFVNKLLGEERHLVSDVAGTTMDAVDSFLEYGGRRYRIIDTAGIRRKRSIGHKVEQFAVVSALKGMDRADVALLLIDALEGVAEQDMKIASFAEEKGMAVVIVVNKWDIAKPGTTYSTGTSRIKKDPHAHRITSGGDLDAETYAKQIRNSMPFLAHAPIRFVSAKTGKRVFDVLDTATELAKEHFRRVPTGEVNRALKAAVEAHQPPMHKGRRTKLYFGTQVRVAPPTFVLACNDPEGVHFSYRRFLMNRFREDFGFGGAPIRLFFRKRKKDVDDDKRGRTGGTAEKNARIAKKAQAAKRSSKGPKKRAR
jgi:GTP-binding protein